MRWARRWGRGGLIAAALLGGGCRQPVDKPIPPDMSALVAAYDSPDGTFSQLNVDEVVSWLEARLGELEELGVEGRLEELWSDFEAHVGGTPASETQGSVETEGGSVTIEGEGFVEITRTCAGWGAQPTPNRDANGWLRLNVNVTDVTVDPVIWATAARCRYRQQDLPIELDAGSRVDVGDLRVWIGPGVSFADLGKLPIIVDLDLSAGVDPEGVGAMAPLRFDVRLIPATSGIEVRVPVSDGAVLVMTEPSGVVAVRALNGTFSCDPVARSCQDGQGNVVTF